MGDQFFEVFKPKPGQEEAEEKPRAVKDPERPVEAAPAQAPRVSGLAFGSDFQQATGVSRAARPGDERAITFRFEEVVVMLIGAMMLMVISFLLGWYGHARSAATAIVAGAPADQAVPEPPADLGEIKPFDPQPLGVTPRERKPQIERPAPPVKPGDVYSLEVIRFPVGDRSSAEATKKKLESRGYAPVFLQTQGREVGVYVGKFASKDDPRIPKYQREIRAMNKHYRWCDVKSVQ